MKNTGLTSINPFPFALLACWISGLILYAESPIGQPGGDLHAEPSATAAPLEALLPARLVPMNAVTVLQNGQAVSGLAAAEDDETHFKITLPQGIDLLVIQISGGTGDADLYVRYGAPVTLDQWDYESWDVANQEIISVRNPQSGDWYIMIEAYESYQGLSLQATYSPATGDGPLKVSNVRAQQRPGSRTVDITYDLDVPVGATATVTVSASRDNGQTFEAVPLASLSGAVGGGQQPGLGKGIAWNVGPAGWEPVLYPAAQVLITAAIGDVGGGSGGYVRGDPAPLTTVYEEKRGSSPTGTSLKVSLGDGTAVTLPDMPSAVELTLSRTNTSSPALDAFVGEMALKPTGAMRVLVVSGEGDPGDLKPLLNIPGAEAGTINRETVSVLRIGDMLVDGEIVENHTMLLAAMPMPDGSLSFIDPLMRDGVRTAVSPAPSAAKLLYGAPAAAQMSETFRWVGEAKYIVMSFQDDLNWSMEPALVRMVPDINAPGNRRVWVESNDDDGEDDAEEGKNPPVVNIVLLVHGHNETEKAGFQAPSHPEPWKVPYKRQVWDLLYEVFQDGESHGAEYPVENTLFYEYIYPSFRSIFSPVSQEGVVRESLGQSLGRLLHQELAKNPQLRDMKENNMRFNFFIVAHSQGGLVARSGLRHMPKEFRDQLQRFVTWGTPHRGAALYSLRYVLGAGHDIMFEGFRFPMQNIYRSGRFQGGLSHEALDTPGIRDLRWSWADRDKLRLGQIVTENSSSIISALDVEIPHGKYFFSQNLGVFNDTEHLELSESVLEKFDFFYGTTSKIADVNLASKSWWPWASRVWGFGVSATAIQKGAYLNKLILADGYQANDGAVAVLSQRSFRFPVGNSVDMGDVDHEEFYGAESPQRNEATLTKGRLVAARTFSSAELSVKNKPSSRQSPEVVVEIDKNEDDDILLKGRVVFPLYDPAFGGDGKVGRRVLNVLAYDAEGKGMFGGLVTSLAFEIAEDGSFVGRLFWENAELPDNPFVVRVLFADHTEVSSGPIDDFHGKIKNQRTGKFYHKIQAAIFEARDNDVIMVSPGTHTEGSQIGISKNIVLRSVEGAEKTTIGNVVFFAGSSPAARLDGFTLMQSQGSSSNAISIYDGSSPIIENCVIRGFTSDAIYCRHGDITIRDNIIENNGRGIIIVVSNEGNSFGTAKIQRNVIRGNTRAGISLNRARFEVSGNTIENNMSGGIDSYDSEGQITRNTIKGNSAGLGGGIYMTGARRPSVSGNTIQGNRASIRGGGVYGAASNWTIHETVQRTTLKWDPVTQKSVEVVENRDAPRHMPPFTETTNTYSGNTCDRSFTTWGPGLDKDVITDTADVHMGYVVYGE